MSHLPYRKEKNCLNCGSEVFGPFCHHCGQENIEPKESTLNLINHFFQDFTHFDGKFFSTLKVLILKPGFLSSEYILGRRTKYLNPVRMYIFTSAIFFFIFFSIYKPGNVVNIGNSQLNIKEKDSIKYEIYKKIPGQGKILTKNEYLAEQKENQFPLGLGNIKQKNNMIHY